MIIKPLLSLLPKLRRRSMDPKLSKLLKQKRESRNLKSISRKFKADLKDKVSTVILLEFRIVLNAYNNLRN
jgi:hypothetical protein